MLKTILISFVSILVILIIAGFIAAKTPSTVVIEHTFNASVDKVWMHWTSVESIKQWWSPTHYTAPVIKCDFQVGGAYLLSMRAADGTMHFNSGIYKEIIPNQKIVTAMSFSDENGKLIPGKDVAVPGSWPDEITVTVEFREDHGDTVVKVTEEGIPSIMYLFAKLGWKQQFDKFENLLK